MKCNADKRRWIVPADHRRPAATVRSRSLGVVEDASSQKDSYSLLYYSCSYRLVCRAWQHDSLCIISIPPYCGSSSSYHRVERCASHAHGVVSSGSSADIAYVPRKAARIYTHTLKHHVLIRSENQQGHIYAVWHSFTRSSQRLPPAFPTLFVLKGLGSTRDGSRGGQGEG